MGKLEPSQAVTMRVATVLSTTHRGGGGGEDAVLGTDALWVVQFECGDRGIRSTRGRSVMPQLGGRRR